MQAGGGGDGVVSFRREAHVPKGGPDGGDGGRGGDVVLVVDHSLRDLQPFRRGRAHYKAARGGHGEGSGRHGASVEPLEVRVPAGTTVSDPERQARWDLTVPGQRVVVARGGLGGKGQRALQELDPPDAAVRRARPARRGDVDRAEAAPARGRRADRAAERGQVVAPRAAHARAAEGRRLPVHHAGAGARDDRGRASARSWWPTSRG